MNDTDKNKIDDKISGNPALGQVLVVEDDIFIADLLDKKLSRSGLKIFRAMDVPSARLILEQEKINAVLLDINLPGEDGITFLQEIKANPKFQHIPVIISSNLSKPEEVERGMKAGADQYIIKANTTAGEIASKVLEAINKHK